MNELVVFEQRPVRRGWNEAEQKWYFSVQDVIEILTDSSDIKQYVKKLKNRDPELSSNWGTICTLVEMTAADGKKRKIQAANIEGIFRLIQSIPSPKAEPLKRWLAKVGYERLQEMADPALSLNRARETWKKHGRSEKWIQQRMTGQETRNKLTDYWKGHDIKEGTEFAILTNVIHEEWSGVSVKTHKEMKGLKTQNLRDHMTEAELIFTALAELSTRQIAESVEATGMDENESAAKTGGQLAKRARLELEGRTGKTIVSDANFLPLPPGKKLEK